MARPLTQSDKEALACEYDLWENVLDDPNANGTDKAKARIEMRTIVNQLGKGEY